MNRLCLTVISFFILNFASSQSISPVQTDEYCPNVEYTFTVTIPKNYQSMMGVGGCYVTQLPTQPVGSTFIFKGKFADANIKQSFRIIYTDNTSYDFEFRKIKSLFYNNQGSQTCPRLNPSTTLIQPARCQVVNIPISVTPVSWYTYGENPDYCFGMITTYEYLLPNGWSIGTNVSDGTRWIQSGSSVTVTSDASHGDGGTIQIRPYNNCGAGLANGYVPVSINISRLRPPLSIISGNGQDYICSGTVNYSISGSLPPGATVTWSLNNSSYVSIPNPGTGTTVPVSFVSQGTATLTATVTDCIETYPAITKNIIAGPYIDGFYTVIANSYSCPGCQFNLTGGASMLLAPNDVATFICNVTSQSLSNINWTWSGYTPTNPIIGNGGLGLTFSLPVASTAWTTRTTYWNITAQHPCGNVNITIPFSVITRGWGFSIVASPNPATNNLAVTFSNESDSISSLSQSENVVMNLYNFNSTQIVKQWKFKNDQRQYNLNVSGLKAGQYILVVYRGKYQSSTQIRIE
jgi:hypothetical protein